MKNTTQINGAEIKVYDRDNITDSRTIAVNSISTTPHYPAQLQEGTLGIATTNVTASGVYVNTVNGYSGGILNSETIAIPDGNITITGLANSSDNWLFTDSLGTVTAYQTEPKFSSIYTDDAIYLNVDDMLWYSVTSATPTLANGKIDFSGLTPLTNGGGIIGKAVLDVSGNVTSVEEYKRSSFSSTFRGVEIVDANYDNSAFEVGTPISSELYSDGSIVGETSNASYIMFANGDLEVRVADDPITVTSGNGLESKVFPIAFISKPSISVTASSQTWAGYYSNNSTTGADIGCWQNSTGSGTVNVSYIAKGRWKA